MTETPSRRLADRLLDDSHREAGREVASEWAGQDRLDPSRPTLSDLVAAVIAEAEERGRRKGYDEGVLAVFSALPPDMFRLVTAEQARRLAEVDQ